MVLPQVAQCPRARAGKAGALLGWSVLRARSEDRNVREMVRDIALITFLRLRVAGLKELPQRKSCWLFWCHSENWIRWSLQVPLLPASSAKKDNDEEHTCKWLYDVD